MLPASAISAASSDAPSRQLPLPESVNRQRIRWPYLIGVSAIHLLALLAVIPALFHWWNALAVFLGLYVFGTLGINLCYHRLLAHRAFRCPRWFEHTLAVLGVCNLQDTPAHWVAIHRLHHQHSDEQRDPHSPLVNFFWSHMEWLWIENEALDRLSMFERYVKDLVRDRFYLRLERSAVWASIHLAQLAVFFLLGAALGWASTGTLAQSALAGVSMVVWGVFVRVVVVWHITWSVNSVTHLWGYRSFATGEGSRNNWWIGLLSNGEGWHNNHHAQPRSAAHGHRWWELDVTFLTIRLFEKLGLTSDVVLPEKSGTRAAT